MFKDLELHEITTCEKPNAHILVIGKSGYGKTYACMRMMEDYYRKGKRICIIDYSSSYTLRELEKNKFEYLDEVNEINLTYFNTNWSVRCKNFKKFINQIVVALQCAFDIDGCNQKEILRLCCGMCIRKKKCFTFAGLLQELNEFQELLTNEKEDFSDDINIIHKLKNKFNLFEDLKIAGVEPDLKNSQNSSRIIILQLSDFSELHKQNLTEFFSYLIWQETQNLKETRKFDVLLLDEFQNMKFSKKKALVQILREGRKFGLAAILSTQFLSNFDSAQINTLMQSGNTLIFHPTVRDLKLLASQIDFENVNIWRKILNNLNVGEAVYLGNYYLNNKNKVFSQPIIVKVVK